MHPHDRGEPLVSMPAEAVSSGNQISMGGVIGRNVTDHWYRCLWYQYAARENLGLDCDFSPPLPAEAPLQIPKDRCIGFVQAGLCGGAAPHEAL
jgi:hypothetical protein